MANKTIYDLAKNMNLVSIFMWVWDYNYMGGNFYFINMAACIFSIILMFLFVSGGYE